MIEHVKPTCWDNVFYFEKLTYIFLCYDLTYVLTSNKYFEMIEQNIKSWNLLEDEG